jgi:hypothetical protein
VESLVVDEPEPVESATSVDASVEPESVVSESVGTASVLSLFEASDESAEPESAVSESVDAPEESVESVLSPELASEDFPVSVSVLRNLV